MTAPLCEWDGAYILGALSPADRLTYEAHLEQCLDCRESVAELGPLPGLLARVPGPARLDSEDLGADGPSDSPGPGGVDGRDGRDGLPAPVETAGLAAAVTPELLPPPPPPSLLPGLLAQVAAARRKRRLQQVVLAAAAVVVSVLVGVLGVHVATSRTAPASPPAVAFVPVSASGPVVASAAVQPVAWGSRISMSCQLETSSASNRWGGSYSSGAEYVLEVAAAGHVERVASWHALADRPAQITAATSTGAADIDELRIADTSGHVLVRLVPSKT